MMNAFATLLLVLLSRGSLANSPSNPGNSQSQGPPAHLLASIRISDKATMGFQMAGDAIVLTVDTDDSEESDNLLASVGDNGSQGSRYTPVQLHEKLTSGKPSPPGLVRAWENVLQKRASKQDTVQDDLPPPDFNDEASYNPLAKPGHQTGMRGNGRQLRGLSSTNDWWATKYCSYQDLRQDHCACYEHMTGNFSRWVEGYETFLYVYANRGNIWRSIEEWTSTGWNTLWSDVVTQDKATWVKVWGPHNYYRGTISNATFSDCYHFSIFATKDSNSTCTHPSGCQTCDRKNY